MNISDLPIIGIGLTVAICLLGVVLRVPASIILVGALIGDFMANRLSFWMPNISVLGQNMSNIILFVAPILALIFVGRKRQIKHRLFDHVLRIVGSFSIVILASRYNYSLFRDLSDSFLRNFSHQVDIYVAVTMLLAVLLLSVSLHKVKRDHHK